MDAAAAQAVEDVGKRPGPVALDFGEAQAEAPHDDQQQTREDAPARSNGIHQEAAGDAARNINHCTYAEDQVEGQSTFWATLCIILAAMSVHVLTAEE